MIAAAALAKAYGPTPALAGVSLEIPQGEIYALLGRNGAGKTTLLNILTTLTRPDRGAARVAGFDVLAEPLAVRQRIGVTFQEPLAERLLRGRDLLELQGELYGLPAAERRARVAELARLLELEDALERPVRSCSGGTARRLELARSLVPRPRVLFLDEPTAGLDLPSREGFWGLIQQLRDADGLTVLLATHAMDEAEAIADRVGILEGGALAAEGAPAALIAAVAGETVTVAGAGPAEAFLAALRAQPWVASADLGGAGGATRLRARLPGAAAPGPQAEVVIAVRGTAGARLKAIIELGERHGFAAADVRLHRPGLAEVFHAHTGRRYREDGDDSR
jgi:ABC-2 type transport system ATP-binding protein